jgi:hypothetical protein
MEEFMRAKSRVSPIRGSRRTFVNIINCEGPRTISASLIGHSGSSAFRLSTTTVSMSLTGSCFSSESALGALPSWDSRTRRNNLLGRPCRQTTVGLKRTCELYTIHHYSVDVAHGLVLLFGRLGLNNPVGIDRILDRIARMILNGDAVSRNAETLEKGPCELGLGVTIDQCTTATRKQDASMGIASR